jgi:CRISPR-associated protein Csd1
MSARRSWRTVSLRKRGEPGPYALVLSPSGELLDVQSLQDTTAKKPQPRALLVPQAIKRTSGVASNFLWDKTSYALGVSGEGSGRLAQEHAAFKALHEDLLAGTEDEGLNALLAFLGGWSPARFAQSPFTPDMLDTNLVFRLDGDTFLHDRPAVRSIWFQYNPARCRRAGERQPAIRHPFRCVPSATRSTMPTRWPWRQ